MKANPVARPRLRNALDAFSRRDVSHLTFHYSNIPEKHAHISISGSQEITACSKISLPLSSCVSATFTLHCFPDCPKKQHTLKKSHLRCLMGKRDLMIHRLRLIIDPRGGICLQQILLYYFLNNSRCFLNDARSTFSFSNTSSLSLLSLAIPERNFAISVFCFKL